MVREDRSEAGFSEVSEFHVSSDLIPRVGPRARVLLLGVRMCRGDNIDAAHDWNARVPVGFGFFLYWPGFVQVTLNIKRHLVCPWLPLCTRAV